MLVWIAAFMVIWAVGSSAVWKPAYSHLKSARMDLSSARLELGRMESVSAGGGHAGKAYEEGMDYFTEHRDHFWPWMEGGEVQERLVDGLDRLGIQVESLRISEKGTSGQGNPSDVGDGPDRNLEGVKRLQIEFTAVASQEALSAFLSREGLGPSAVVVGYHWDRQDTDEASGRSYVRVRMDVRLLQSVE